MTHRIGTGTRRRILLGGALAAPALTSPWLARRAAAQPSTSPAPTPWPTDRPVRIIVPLAAGGTADFLARSLAAALQEVTGGGNFVVENRTGGGGAVAWSATARAPADGTTIAFADNSLALAAALGRDLGFDPVADLVPVTTMVRYAPLIVVNAALPARTLPDFIAYARARPGALFFGSNGTGGIVHLQTELLMDAAGIRMNHVGYRGMAQAVTDLVADRLQMILPVLPTVAGQVRGGALRVIAVGTAEGRVPALPDVPSARETGTDFTSDTWFGLIAPRGTPPAMANAMRAAIAAAVALPSLKGRVEEAGGRLDAGPPEALRQTIAAETATWARVVREKGIQPE